MSFTILSLIGLVCGALVYSFVIYNALIRLDAETERAWANIDVILKQRFDEIPQIVEVVEQFAKHEQGLIERLVEARSRYGNAQSIEQKIEASNQAGRAFGGVMALAENYPDIKTSRHFLHLQERVSMLEETLAHRRESFNEAITLFNTRIRQVPDIFVARLLNFERRKPFEVLGTEKQAPGLRII